MKEKMCDVMLQELVDFIASYHATKGYILIDGKQHSTVYYPFRDGLPSLHSRRSPSCPLTLKSYGGK